MIRTRRRSRHGRQRRLTSRVLGVSFFVLGVLGALAAPARDGRKPLVFENARILTMDGPPIEAGTLLVQGDRIAAVGATVDVPRSADRTDLRGATITPGLIDPFSAWAGSGSSSGSAATTRRAEDAFDRYDTRHLDEVLANGVTAVYVSPGGPGGTCGMGAVIRLAPDGPEALGHVLQSEAALCVDLDSAGKPVARLKTLVAVEKQFREALEYRRALEQYDKDLAEYTKKLKQQASKNKAGKPNAKPAGGEPAKKPAAEQKGSDKKEQQAGPGKPKRPSRKPGLQIVLRAIDREMPVRVRAYRSQDILNALELAERFSLDLILEGGSEAHLVAERIAGAEVPVVLAQPDRFGRRRNDLFRRTTLHQAAALDRAGVSWVVGTGVQNGLQSRFVAMQAQLALARGGAGDPLARVTSDAADVLGVGDRIGRLRPGLLADFVVWSGDPLDPATEVLRVYAGGVLAYQADAAERKGGAP